MARLRAGICCVAAAASAWAVVWAGAGPPAEVIGGRTDANGRTPLHVAVDPGRTGAIDRQDYGLLKAAAQTDERRAPIDALKARAPGLAAAFAPYVYQNQTGERMPYRLFTPARLERGRTYPLVVFLHGAGGSGTDNSKQLEGGNLYGALVWTLPENQARHPAFVLAPQSDWNWPCTVFDPANPPKIAADIKLCPPGALGIGARLAFDVIDRLVASLPIDRDRVYVTGHSMGGAGTWHMIAQRPRLFAAAVPICGRGHPESAPLIKEVPVWNFHGAKDEIEPVTSSRELIEALRRTGGRPRHTEYSDLGHEAFAWAYTEPALVEWLFAQRRPADPSRRLTGLPGASGPPRVDRRSSMGRRTANVTTSCYTCSHIAGGWPDGNGGRP